MNKFICTLLFIFSFNFFIFSQTNMLTYIDPNGAYQIDYPEDWQVLTNENQVSFVSSDESMMSGVAYGILDEVVNSSAIMEETLKIIGVTNELNEDESTATEEELQIWGADNAKAATFTMTQEDVTYSYILIIMTKNSFYYSLMFVINTMSTTLASDEIIKTIGESFRISN